MDPEIATRIFDRFYSTRSPSGGLGLAATAAIMRRHDGAIWLSTHRGEGSRFRLFFPVAKRTAASGGDIPAAARLESVRRDAPADVSRGMAPARADWPAWLPVSFGKRCPCCGSATHRIRTAWYARPVRFFLPRYSSTRRCFDCHWVGLTLHRG